MTDLLGRTARNRPGPNLFTPDFGLPPHRLVGRGNDMEVIQDGLGAGPGDPRFTSVIIGHRGSGKTVLLKTIRDIAAEAGWVVLRTDAITAGLHERISEEIADYENKSVASDLIHSDDDVETTVGLNIDGVSVSRRKSKSRRPERSLRKKLEILGKSAAERESAVLLCVDELQGGQRDELRRLSSDLQRLTKEDGLPIAFIGAGLPSVAYGIMRDSKMTFFQRCHTHTLPPLDDTSVAMFFHRAIRDADGICEPDVIQRMTHAADGFPYKMQIIGNNAWQFAEAPRQPIDAASAELAISAAEHHLNSTVYRHVWETLSTTDQQILRTVASHGGRIARSELGAAIPVSSSYLTSCVNRLVDYGCVIRPENIQSNVCLGTLAPFNFVTGIVQEEAAYKPPSTQTYTSSRAAKPGSQGRSRFRPRCGKRLKTKNVKCILPAGHNGNCRSR